MNDLLIPRYKVIAPYPHSPYRIGQLVEFSTAGTNFHCTTTSEYDSYDGESKDCENYFSIDKIDEYPHLFKKLHWSEDRKEHEMPEYVKVVKNAKGFGLSDNCIRPVVCWDMKLSPPRADCFPVIINAENLLPATKEEYHIQEEF